MARKSYDEWAKMAKEIEDDPEPAHTGA